MAGNIRAGVKGFQSIPLKERFLEKVQVTDGCWNWLGYKTPYGHGYIWNNGKNVPAHRVSYEIHKGVIPRGMVIDHLCRNPSCVNPCHLEAVTHGENIRRGWQHSATANEKKTHCKHGHALNGKNLRPDKNGRRQCRECARNRDRARRAKARGES